MKKVKERAEQNTITVRDKANGSKEARITLKLCLDKGNRIAKCAKTKELAVYKLLEEIDSYIDLMIQNSLINYKINTIIASKLMKSINELNITSPEITEKVLLIINKINNFNGELDRGLTIQNKIVPIKPNIENNKVDICNNNNINAESKLLDLIDNVVVQWKRYELELCKKTDENPRPLSQKTVDGYCCILDNNIIPFFKNCKIMYLQQISEDIIRILLKETKGYNQKRLTYIVLNLFFKYFKKQKRINENPMNNIDKPKKPSKIKDETISCIDPKRFDIWIEKFEEENTDMSLLWETMLCLGLRPEEACGLKWTSLDLKTNEIIIDNAYKSFVVYDENLKPIGHTRRDDKVKTIESIRRIPISDHLIEVLLRHKQNQKQRFKESIKMNKKGKKWSEKEYMFLGRTYKPYVSDTLSSAMPKFCDKYNLERMTPYGLRRSFATNFSYKNDDAIALQVIMGHSNYETTQKSYIKVFEDRKKEAMNKVFSKYYK